MKNEKEFREAVYEKARRYEQKRKQARRRIIEAISLCSVCVAIGVSAWLILPHTDMSISENYPLTTESADNASKTETTTSDDQNQYSFQEGEESPQASLTTVTSAVPSSSADTATTTDATFLTTAANTTDFTDFTDLPLTGSAFDTSFLYDIIEDPENSNPHYMTPDLTFTLSHTPATRRGLFIVKNTEELRELMQNYDDTLSEFDQRELFSTYDTDFFGSNALVIVVRYMRYAGYSVYFKSDGATAFESMGRELPFSAQEFHTYSVPIAHYDEWNVLQYRID